MDKRLVTSISAAIVLAFVVNLAISMTYSGFLQAPKLLPAAEERKMGNKTGEAVVPMTVTKTLTTTPSTTILSAVEESRAERAQVSYAASPIHSLTLNIVLSFAMAAAVFLVFQSKTRIKK